MTSRSSRSSETVLAHHLDGLRVALGAEPDEPLVNDRQETVPLHPRHSLRHRRTGLVQPLDDPGTTRGDALLEQLVDRAEIHLRRVDQLAHLGCLLREA